MCGEPRKYEGLLNTTMLWESLIVSDGPPITKYFVRLDP